jgi:hypothetical protein
LCSTEIANLDLFLDLAPCVKKKKKKKKKKEPRLIGLEGKTAQNGGSISQIKAVDWYVFLFLFNL